ncbi:MAG: hypothetical protein ABJQ71_01315 [Roseibium sp.]|uniref:hypothetical protein n=1 Tax=Roseibium polysiphoniae TaxID=2571221 RepID=UPI003299659C
MQPLTEEKLAMRKAHREERKILKAKQRERWRQEERQRHDRLRKGMSGLWDRMTGRTRSTIAKNDKEAWDAHKRDQRQRETLIIEQLKERTALQKNISVLRKKHIRDRRILAREINQTLKTQARDPQCYEMTRDHDHDRTRYQGPSLRL